MQPSGVHSRTLGYLGLGQLCCGWMPSGQGGRLAALHAYLSSVMISTA
jgi:hypothetical protein